MSRRSAAETYRDGAVNIVGEEATADHVAKHLSWGRGALLSQCQRYRYLLWRRWGEAAERPARWATFIMLNPSTADGLVDDPTLRRCVGFARQLTYDGVMLVNLFAWRATSPADMALAATQGSDVVGRDRDPWVRFATERSELIVAGWGAFGPARVASSKMLLRTMNLEEDTPTRAWRCLGTNADGSPKHPLYLSGRTAVRPWEGYR
jgi:hypothetical protein